MKKILLGILVGVLWAAASQAGEQINGCYSKENGNLRVIFPPSKCRTSEVPISWNNVESTSNAAGAVKVLDANGQYLGILQDYDIYVPNLKKLVELDIYQTSVPVGDIAWEYMYFESSDCSGQPYVTVDDAAFVFAHFGKYYTGSNLPAKVAVIKSSSGADWSQSGASRRYTCSDTSAYPYTTAVVPAVEVELPFATPVALPVRMEQ